MPDLENRLAKVSNNKNFLETAPVWRHSNHCDQTISQLTWVKRTEVTLTKLTTGLSTTHPHHSEAQALNQIRW